MAVAMIMAVVIAVMVVMRGLPDALCNWLPSLLAAV
jgi:hypothetical protein